jgi:mycothiol system anti-sigma-R factor
VAECDDAVERLYHFLDGELDDTRRADIKRHLDECMPCLEAFDFEAELRIVIAQKCRDEVPTHLRDRIVNALRQEPPLSL